MTAMLPLALVPLAQDYCGWAEFAQVADATTGTLALDGDTIWGAGADAKGYGGDGEFFPTGTSRLVRLDECCRQCRSRHPPTPPPRLPPM